MVFQRSMAPTKEEERLKFERYARQLDLQRLSETLLANEKLIRLVKQHGQIPQVLEMMQAILRKELDRQERKD